MWPLKLAHVLLAMTYFSTGVTKLLAGGFRWMNGYTLQAYTFEDAIRRELPVGIWLGQHHTLCLLLSIFTILFETFFFLSLFFPRAAPFFFINGLFFQIGLYVAAGHPFFQHMVLLLLLLLFIAPPWWRAWLGKYLDPRLGQAEAPQPLYGGTSTDPWGFGPWARAEMARLLLFGGQPLQSGHYALEQLEPACPDAIRSCALRSAGAFGLFHEILRGSRAPRPRPIRSHRPGHVFR